MFQPSTIFLREIFNCKAFLNHTPNHTCSLPTYHRAPITTLSPCTLAAPYFPHITRDTIYLLLILHFTTHPSRDHLPIIASPLIYLVSPYHHPSFNLLPAFHHPITTHHNPSKADASSFCFSLSTSGNPDEYLCRSLHHLCLTPSTWALIEVLLTPPPVSQHSSWALTEVRAAINNEIVKKKHQLVAWLLSRKNCTAFFRF